jgi:anhydro-N-acetylmuramic acid kinase
MKTKYRMIGLMSGSSLDGVDLACCDFSFQNEKWEYQILCGETIPYPEMWQARLQDLHKQAIEIFPKTHAFYGRYLGKLVQEFIQKNKLVVDAIASHGHTIFHQPQLGFTAQIGDGAAIAAETNLPVISDFRNMDIALGGQGAPLVPIGDQLLFSEYDACLNLGGISNISFTQLDQTKAFDISPCNSVLNLLANSLGQPYDDKGRMAASGTINQELLAALNGLDYYQQKGAKSLGREWISETIYPLLQQFSDLSEVDLLATFTNHIAFQISETINRFSLKSVLVTGGGAFNDYLIHQIQEKVEAKISIPSSELVQFKEALIFAFLGVLRISNQINVLASATGAKRDQVSGALHGNFNSLI